MAVWNRNDVIIGKDCFPSHIGTLNAHSVTFFNVFEGEYTNLCPAEVNWAPKGLLCCQRNVHWMSLQCCFFFILVPNEAIKGIGIVIESVEEPVVEPACLFGLETKFFLTPEI